MAQAQLDKVCYTIPEMSHSTRENNFHISLDAEHSLTICKRKEIIHIGIYRRDSKGRNRGVSLPLIVWQIMQSSADIIDLAVSVIDGKVGYETKDQEE